MVPEGQTNEALINKQPFRVAILVGCILFLVSSFMAFVGEGYE